MKKIKLVAILIAILFSLVIVLSCERLFGGDDDRLLIVNNSENRLYLNEQLNYPDTTIDIYNPSCTKENMILPKSSKTFHSRSWEQLVITAESDTIMFFLYNADLVDNTSWDTIIKNYSILKRYTFSLDDLNSIKWKIIYP